MRTGKSLRVLAAAALLASGAVLSHRLTTHAAAPGALPDACRGVPVTQIVVSRTTHAAVFSPRTITVHANKDVSFCVTNTAGVTEGVTYYGEPILTLRQGATGGIHCVTPNTTAFRLASDPLAKLTVTCTH